MNQDNNTLGQFSQQPGVVGDVLQQPQVADQQQSGVVVQQQMVAQSQIVQPETSVVVEEKTSVQTDVMACPKCGSPMKKDSRYCMKCGQLNYSHPDNESMKQYAWQSIKQGNYVYASNSSNDAPLSMKNSVSNSNPFRVCLITDIILHTILILFPLILSLVIGAKVTVLVIGVSVIVNLLVMLYEYSMQAIYIKSGEPWWGVWVPLYNTYLLYKIALGSGWLMLTILVPILGEVIIFMLFFCLGKKFYKNGWITMFFPFVMIPVIGLDKNSEYSLLARSETDTSVMVDPSGKTKSEKQYKLKKIIITLLLTVIASVVLYVLWPYIKPFVEKVYDFIITKIEQFK